MTASLIGLEIFLAVQDSSITAIVCQNKRSDLTKLLDFYLLGFASNFTVKQWVKLLPDYYFLVFGVFLRILFFFCYLFCSFFVLFFSVIFEWSWLPVNALLLFPGEQL